MNGYLLMDFHGFIDTPVSSNPRPDDVPVIDDTDIKKRNNSLDSKAGTMEKGVEHSVDALLSKSNCHHIQPPTDGSNSLFSESIVCNSSYQTENHGSACEKKIPEVLLFKDGTGVTINDTAKTLGEIYASKERLFRRIIGNGNVQTQQIQNLDKERNLKVFSPDWACSEFEKVAKIVTLKKHQLIHAVLKECDAKKLIACESFSDLLPPLKILTRCPVIVEMPNGDTRIITNYDRDHGIFAMGEKSHDMDVKDAVEIILSSIDEFLFKSPPDKSRAIASIITPALIMGGIANFRSPIDLIEADESQAGKGFKTRLSAAYYNEIPYSINQQRGGVGSLEESMNHALIEGRIFINLDNLTPVKNGVFNSEKLCSFMTEDRYYARMLRRGIFIDPRLHIIQMTTNGCSLSKDLMNRSCPIAIQKRRGYKYKKYREGSILDHIRHNQPKFLGAVFSIIKAWVLEGKPKTTTMAHDSSFTPWAQSLDWIVQNIMNQAPLLDGYQQVRDRITSPYLQKLRSIALMIIKTPRRKDWLTVSDIIEIVGPEGVELPGIDSEYNFETLTDGEKDSAKIQLGASFKRAFDHHGQNDILIIDGVKIQREERSRTYDYGTTKEIKFYHFSEMKIT